MEVLVLSMMDILHCDMWYGLLVFLSPFATVCMQAIDSWISMDQCHRRRHQKFCDSAQNDALPSVMVALLSVGSFSNDHLHVFPYGWQNP